MICMSTTDELPERKFIKSYQRKNCLRSFQFRKNIASRFHLRWNDSARDTEGLVPANGGYGTPEWPDAAAIRCMTGRQDLHAAGARPKKSIDAAQDEFIVRP